jgi:hypothetical protein
MKASELKKLAEQEYAKYFTLWEYFLVPKKGGFYCKKRTDELTIGLYPFLRQRNDCWDTEFWFGIYYAPIEKEVDLLGGRNIASSETDPRFALWTTCDWNINFPPEYALVTTQTESGPFTVATNNSYLEADWNEEQVLEKVRTNIEFIQKYTLPWLEQVSSLEHVLKRLSIEARLARLPVALLIANEFEKLDSWVLNHRQSKSQPQFNDYPFWDNLLKSAAQKEKSSIPT